MAGLSGNNIRSALRSALAPTVHKLGLSGPYRGNVDGLHAGAVVGWVVHSRSGEGRVPVGLFTSGGMIASMTADVPRGDVARAGIGQEPCGFEFKLTDTLRQQAAMTDGQIYVRVLDNTKHEIGSLNVPTEQSVQVDVGRHQITECRTALFGDLQKLLSRLNEVGEVTSPLPPVKQPPFTRHQTMFDTANLLPDLPASGHPAYLDYVRYRYRMDEQYDVGPGLDAADHYLYWYLTAYRSQEKRRVPLSSELIDYLNAPITMAGNRYNLSRIMWWRLMGRKDMLGNLNLNSREAYIELIFWWVHQDCPALFFEDCLVPDRFADLMRGVHPSRRNDPYPLSYFLDFFYRHTPQLQFLDAGTDRGRQTLVLAIMIMASRRPDLLRYVPHRSIQTLLAPRPDGVSDFERFLRALTNDTALRVPHDRYVAALRLAGYDMQSHRFMSRSPEGHRFEGAAMPAPDAARPKVDVQLIGPLAKASGLGQATRLSADILRKTGLTVRGVDFDLDNPAPEGFSSDTMIEDYGPAKVNIIHLNAESIPLAYAYQPDVFSGAYNIGYFFWELDKPAYCHYLGMELLDEIWVSTNYGVEIYAPDAKGRPVINVGMCFEENTDIDRADARAFVNQRFLFDASHYVCLVAFDSFSFVQRKNPVSVLQAFQKAFEGVENARLVVKTQNRDSVFDPVQVQLWDRVEAIIASDHRIVVMNETLTYRDLLRLKAGSDCYISLHKSEGWGFGMIEAMSLKVPVVCTAYSGNMDFCTAETAWLVDYEETLLKPGDYIFVRKGSKWAEPDVASAAAQLRAAYDDPAARKAKAEAAYAYIRANFSVDAIAKRYGGRLREVLKGL